VAALGFEAYELIIIGDRPPVSLSGVRADIAGLADRLSEAVAQRGLVWADVFVIPGAEFTTLTANHPDQRERDAGRAVFRDMLEFVHRLGAPGLTMLPGIDWPGESHDESLARSASELAVRATETRDRGLGFSIEPHMGSLCHTPDDILRLCEMAPGLELTLDYGHYTAVGVADHDLEPLLVHTRHFHARPAARGRLQTPLKENTIDFERAIDALRQLDYDGFVLVEYLWAELDPRLDPVDILSETILLRDRLRAKLGSLPWRYPEFAKPLAAAATQAE
jgi:sugar phosphate isomerase/epimerase